MIFTCKIKLLEYDDVSNYELTPDEMEALPSNPKQHYIYGDGVINLDKERFVCAWLDHNEDIVITLDNEQYTIKYDKKISDYFEKLTKKE